MHNKEKIMDFQILISRRHVGLLITLLMVIMNLLVFSGEEPIMKYFPMSMICVALLIDLAFAYFKYFHSIVFLTVMRCACLLGIGLMVGDSSSGVIDGLNNLVVFMFYLLFASEITMLFDVTEISDSVRISLWLQAPFVVRCVYYIVTGASSHVMSIVTYLSLAIICFLVIFAISSIYGKMQKDSEQMVFAKERIIDKAKDNSDKVTESRQELRELNEQLGLKKFQLEDVNRQINEMNNNFNVQNKFLNLFVDVANSPKLIESVANTFKEEFDLDYAGAIFRDDFLRKYYPSNIEKYIGREFLDDFNDFFMSDAFIDSHSGVGNDFICNEINYDDFPYLEAMQAGSMMVRAIHFGESSGYNGICVYVLISRHRGAFGSNQALLDSIFAQLCIAFENLALYRQMEELSVKDPLSTLYNRRYMNLYFEKNIIKKQGSERAVSLAMIDIDHFKNVNDTYGHLFGDIAIKTVAGIIKKCAEEHDGMSFRYGGEEFVIMFDGMKIDEAKVILEDMRQEIKATAVANEQYSIHVNVSIGLTEYPSRMDDISKIVDRADRAMYYSKQHGRDQLVIDDGQV